MITLILVHPTQPTAVNRWTFKDQSMIRVGRAKDNDVIIYNSVVSRYHLELWHDASGWEIISFGTNGSYCNKKPITQMSVTNGMVIFLGQSGPRLLIKLSPVTANKINKPTSQSLSVKSSVDSDFSKEPTEVQVKLEEVEEENSTTLVNF